MRHIGRLTALQQLIEAGADGVKVALFHQHTCDVGASDCLAHPLIRQYLGLTDLVAEPPQELHDLREARPSSLADLLECFLQIRIVDVDVVAQNMNIMSAIARTESHSGDQPQAAGGNVSALIQLRHTLNRVVICNGDVAQPRSLCRFHDLLRRISAVREGRMDMQIAWHISSP